MMGAASLNSSVVNKMLLTKVCVHLAMFLLLWCSFLLSNVEFTQDTFSYTRSDANSNLNYVFFMNCDNNTESMYQHIINTEIE